MKRKSTEKTKVIVIGLDGASFELIDPWIEEGALPTMRRIKEEGVYGDLISCLPPVTSPNWKCYSTGMNPGKLGIFWWENIDVKNKRIFYPRNRTRVQPELWDIIGERGKVCVINMPTTYPPKEVNGFFVAGPPDCPDYDFFHPPEMKEILNEFHYKVSPKRVNLLQSETGKDQARAATEIREIIDTKFKLAHALITREKPIFLHLTIFYINVLQHFLWDSDFTKEAWRLIDQRIGEFIDSFSNEYTFFFMSDHGSNKITKVFNINTWLEKKGYLVTNTGKGSLLNTIGLNIDNLARVYHLLGTGKPKKAMRTLVPDRLLHMLPTREGTFKKESKAHIIDWEKSQAVASGQGPIYILANESGKGEIKEKLRQDLETLKNEGIIRDVYAREEIYSGEYLDEAPDLILDQGKGIHIKGDIGNKEIVEKPNKWRGENKRLGMFLAYGSSIQRNDKIDSVTILDIAPTILHLLDIPIPKGMDGQILKDIFAKDSEVAERPPTYQEAGERQRIKDRLARLSRSGRI